MVFSLSGAVVPTRGRRATLPARPQRPPAAAARDLQSPRRAQEVCVACKLFPVQIRAPSSSFARLLAAVAYEVLRLRNWPAARGRLPVVTVLGLVGGAPEGETPRVADSSAASEGYSKGARVLHAASLFF